MTWGGVLKRIDANKFYDLIDDVITFDNENGTMHASLPIPGELYFSGDRLQPLQLSVSELTGFVGNFHSEELDSTYTLSVENGRLTLRSHDDPPVPLDAAAHDEFYSSDLGTIVFQTNASHRVSGFSLFTQAARGIIFTARSNMFPCRQETLDRHFKVWLRLD
jgi:hypothetical protein